MIDQRCNLNTTTASSIGVMDTVLVVDDEIETLEDLSFALTQEGFNVVEANGGEQALNCVEHHSPSLIVLDVLMEPMNGIDFCLKLRQTSGIPIIFISSRQAETDILLGLKVGGTDYVPKTITPKVLALKVRAMLDLVTQEQQSLPKKADVQQLSHCGIRLDVAGRRTFFEDQEINLTPQEFELLTIMMRNPGVVHSKDDIIDQLSKSDDPDDTIFTSTLDAHVFNIRKKFKELGTNPVETKFGHGLILKPCD